MPALGAQTWLSLQRKRLLLPMLQSSGHSAELSWAGWAEELPSYPQPAVLHGETCPSHLQEQLFAIHTAIPGMIPFGINVLEGPRICLKTMNPVVWEERFHVAMSTGISLSTVAWSRTEPRHGSYLAKPKERVTMRKELNVTYPSLVAG